MTVGKFPSHNLGSGPRQSAQTFSYAVSRIPRDPRGRHLPGDVTLTVPNGIQGNRPCGPAYTDSWRKRACVNEDGIIGRTKLEIMIAAACEIRVKKTGLWSFLRIVSVADSISCLFSTGLRGSNPTLSAMYLLVRAHSYL